MTTVDRVKAVCKSKKIAISTLEKALGYSNGYIGKLKKGVLPDDRLVDIARFLEVPVSYLTGWEDAVSNLTAAGMSEIDVAEEMGIDLSVLKNILSGNDSSSVEAVSKFITVASLLAKKEKPTLQMEDEPFEGYSDLTEEEKKQVRDYAAFLLASRHKQ